MSKKNTAYPNNRVPQQVAWDGYKKLLLSKGVKEAILDALEEKLCLSVWISPAAMSLQANKPLTSVEETSGDSDFAGRNDSLDDVIKEIFERQQSLLSDRNGRRLGGAREEGRTQMIIEEWEYGLSRQLELRQVGRLRFYEKRLPRLLAHGFAKYWQFLEIRHAYEKSKTP